MARYRKKKRGSHKAKPSILSMVPIAFLGVRAIDGYKAGGLKQSGAYVIDSVSGWNINQNTWNLGPETMAFYGSIAASYVGKKVVAATGVNRALKGLPFRL